MPRRGATATALVYSPQPEPRFAPNGYRLPDRIKEGEILTDMTQKQWRLGRAIGVGGFGEIYLASDDVKRPVGADCQHVIKVEPHKNGPLFVEMNFYLRVAKPTMIAEWMRQRRKKRFGMPCFCGAGSHKYKGEQYRFLVLPRFGTDLHKLFLKHGRRFHVRTALSLAIHILDILEYIHEHGYCHADIKDSNLLMGLTNNNDDGQVYLLDYGLASKYRYSDGRHKEYRCDLRKAHDGTLEYTSRDAHIGAHSRRGDLEILGYNLVHWLSSRLPWEDELADPEMVAEMKHQCMANINQFLQTCFCDIKPPGVLAWYLNYVAGLEFETKPDYSLCKQMLMSEIRKQGFTYSQNVTFDPAPPLKKTKSVQSRKRKAVSEPEILEKLPQKKSLRNECNRMTRGSTPASSFFEESFSWEKVLLSNPDKIGREEAKRKKASSNESGRGKMNASPIDQTIMSPSTARQIALDTESLRNPTPAMLVQMASLRRKARPVSPNFGGRGRTKSESSRCSSPVDGPTMITPNGPTILTPAMEDVLRRRLRFEGDGKENRNVAKSTGKKRPRMAAQPRRLPLKPTCRKQIPVRHSSIASGGVSPKKDAYRISKKYLRSFKNLRNLK